MRTRSALLAILLVLAICAFARPAAADACDNIKQFLGNKATNVTCFVSTDLTTNNPLTTPPDNSITGLPAFAFTPRTDRNVLIPEAALFTPPTKVVPGIQVSGYFTDDPTGEARFLLRFPNDWNGKLVVAGTPSQRSEFASDYAWSDYVVQKGYAYASQNKGVLAFYVTTSTDPLGCRLNPDPVFNGVFVHFYDDEATKPFTQWTHYMIKATVLAQEAVKSFYHHEAHRTYAVGTSNGGYQVRRALEKAPELYDGGVDWEGTFVDPRGPNIMIDLPPVIANFPAYRSSGYDPNSSAAAAITASGYPPDIYKGGVSLWGLYWTNYWELTMCQWQKRFDPTYDTYNAGLGNYDYFSRLHVPGVFHGVHAVETSGDIGKPLITVAGTMDSLLPIKRGARAYEANVLEARESGHDWDDDRDGHHHHPAYRLYEVQNGNHIENYHQFFPNDLQLVGPRAQQAFDLLVDYVEHDAKLPPSQCIPKGGAISSTPAQAGHCASLYVP